MGIKTFLLQSLLDKLVDALEIPVKRLDDTLNATKDLLQLILTSVGKPDPEKLLWKKHCLFLTILQAGRSSEDKVNSLNNQVLIACSLSTEGKWCKPTQVREVAGQDQWCFCAVGQTVAPFQPEKLFLLLLS